MSKIENPEILKYEPSIEMSLDEAMNFTQVHFDYFWLSGNSKIRQDEKQRFAADMEYVPTYDYPLLRDHVNGGYLDGSDLNNSLDEVKKIISASAVIEQNRETIGNEVADLYISMFDVMRDRELLVELAFRATTAGSAESKALWREKFMEVNERLYGKIDEQLYLGIMDTEKRRVAEFNPINEADHRIKRDLDEYFKSLDIGGAEEKVYLPQEIIDQYKPIIEEEYSHILEVVPDTDDSVVYNDYQVVHFMNLALEAGGLSEKGWVAKINDKSSPVSTDTSKKTILIPPGDTRTARQLRALMIHEQEVHARRGQNGLESKLPGLLANGTANYGDSEEGLGVVLECVVNGTSDNNPALKRARDRYIHVGLAAGIGDGIKKDAREVFEIAWRLEAVNQAIQAGGSITPEIEKLAKMGKWGSVTHIENIFRGTDFSGKGVDYTKAKVYLEGFIANAKKLIEINGDLKKFRKLFIGKYDHTDSNEAEVIESNA